jgi:hypothetical protein
MEVAYSVNGVPIRLTYERWYHIVENHDELASYFHDVLDTIEKPDFVARGSKGSLKASRNMGRRKWLVVIYRELSERDGFVITAYLLDRKPKGEVIWRQ